MKLVLAAALLLLTPVQRPADIVKWSADAPTAPVRAGGVAKIALTANVEPGWKLYALTQPKGGPVPLAIKVAKDSPFSIVGKNIEPPLPKVQKDESFSLDTQYYEHEAKFVVPVTVPKTVAAGPQVVPVEVTFQACGESICLRPFTQRLDVKVTVTK
jgi:DsbC/DsbD-like thiol-disulfide interchange protein